MGKLRISPGLQRTIGACVLGEYREVRRAGSVTAKSLGHLRRRLSN